MASQENIGSVGAHTGGGKLTAAEQQEHHSMRQHSGAVLGGKLMTAKRQENHSVWGLGEQLHHAASSAHGIISPPKGPVAVKRQEHHSVHQH